MDFSALIQNPSLWGIFIVVYMVVMTPNMIKWYIDRKDKISKNDEKTKDCKDAEMMMMKVTDTLTSFIVTINKLNDKIDVLNINVDKVHTSVLQAVVGFESSNDITSRGFNHLSDAYGNINDNLNRSVDRIENLIRDLRK